MRVTRKFIAEKAGVSPTAVSDIINKNPKARISEKVRARVLDIAKEYNYIPNMSAKSLVMKKTFNIGLMYKDSMVNFLDDPFSHEVFLGIESELDKNDYAMIFSILKDEAALNPSAQRMIYGHFVDGIVLCGSIDKKIVKALTENKIPFVIIDFLLNKIKHNAVLPDNEHGAYEAVKFLIDNGCKSIVCLNGFPGKLPHPSYLERPEGYKKAMLEAGLPANMLETEPDMESSYDFVKKYLKNNKAPDAFFATGDHMALGCLKAVKESGRKIRIIGFDNISWASNENYLLSTVNVPKTEMGAEAVRLLLQNIANPEASTKVLRLTPSLVIRST
jgi:LacI family transcriptional regulator